MDSEDGGPYLTATINEALRSRPVVPNAMPRYVAKPITVGGWDYEPGVSLVANAYLIHHDPEIYPDPYTFRPERFLDEKPGTYTWIPFGGGRRRCLGSSFAILEMKVVIAELVRRFEIRATSGEPELARRRNITMRPAHGRQGRPRRKGARAGTGMNRRRRAAPLPHGRAASSSGWAGSRTSIGAAVVFMAIGFLVARLLQRRAARPARRGEPAAPRRLRSSSSAWSSPIVAKRRRDRALGWLREGREPTDEERRLTLGLPAFAALVTAAGWGAASVLGVASNLDHGVGTAAIIAVAVWLGGETCSALTYLLFETDAPPGHGDRPRRPPAAGARRRPGVRDRLLVAWSLGTGAPVLACSSSASSASPARTPTPRRSRPRASSSAASRSSSASSPRCSPRGRSQIRSARCARRSSGWRRAISTSRCRSTTRQRSGCSRRGSTG